MADSHNEALVRRFFEKLNAEDLEGLENDPAPAGDLEADEQLGHSGRRRPRRSQGNHRRVSEAGARSLRRQGSAELDTRRYSARAIKSSPRRTVPVAS